jgi:Gtp-binding protein of the ras superfamily involved in termination of M-phase
MCSPAKPNTTQLSSAQLTAHPLRQARKFAKAMKAPLVFTSATHSVNVQKLFKVVLAKVFDLKCTLDKIEEVGEPLLIF